MDCIFCKIINKDIPNYTVYEDNSALAFLDIFPHAKGHTVVIPKVHVETITDFTPELLSHFLESIKQTVQRIDTVLHPEGYNIGWNHGVAGGQAVRHFHTHILPRWQGDNGGSMHSIIKSPVDMTVEALAKLF